MLKFYSCLLCSKRISQQDRFKTKKEHADFIKRRLCVEVTNDNMLCRKCRHMCETKSTRDSACDCPGPKKISKASAVQSPSSVVFSIPSTSKSHINCVNNKDQFIVVPGNTRLNVLIKTGSICCPKHITYVHFNTDTL